MPALPRGIAFAYIKWICRLEPQNHFIGYLLMSSLRWNGTRLGFERLVVAHVADVCLSMSLFATSIQHQNHVYCESTSEKFQGHAIEMAENAFSQQLGPTGFAKIRVWRLEGLSTPRGDDLG